MEICDITLKGIGICKIIGFIILTPIIIYFIIKTIEDFQNENKIGRIFLIIYWLIGLSILYLIYRFFF